MSAEAAPLCSGGGGLGEMGTLIGRVMGGQGWSGVGGFYWETVGGLFVYRCTL